MSHYNAKLTSVGAGSVATAPSGAATGYAVFVSTDFVKPKSPPIHNAR